jgi:hypothetical protein
MEIRKTNYCGCRKLRIQINVSDGDGENRLLWETGKNRFVRKKKTENTRKDDVKKVVCYI